MSFEINATRVALSLLNKEQILHLKELLSVSDSKISDEDFVNIIKGETINPLKCCPSCGSQHIVKNGSNILRKQCYKCKDCGRNYCSSTNSFFSYTKKPVEKWINYIKCMCDGLSIRATAKKTNINRNTSFNWRHKILEALKSSLPDGLSGIVEIDEIKIAESFKGNHCKNKSFELERSPRRRGLTHLKRLMVNKVSILCCIDRNMGILSEVTGSTKSNFMMLSKVLKNKIAKGSIICTTNNMAFVGVAKKFNLKLYKMTHKTEIKKEVYHIKNASAFGEGFKKFLIRFNGVATKHMNSYITWFKWLNISQGFSESSEPMESLLISTVNYNRPGVCDFQNRLNKFKTRGV